MKNHIYNLLQELEIISPGKIVKCYPKVRDRDDIEVLKCDKSGVMFLSAIETQNEYYNKKEGTSYWSSSNRDIALKSTYEDDSRRFDQFKHLIINKKYLDFGTGLGGVLDLFKDLAAETFGVELQNDIRDLLNKNHKVYESLDAIPEHKVFDVVTLFHVFEHLTEPLAVLKNINKRLETNGKIVIEVPHANDALLASFNLESFKKFTFWSEHLILHTRESLTIFLKEAGFKNITIKGFQRYPLANHLNWLANNEPGGHSSLYQFRDKNLEKAYSNLLKNINQTDTLIAIAEK